MLTCDTQWAAILTNEFEPTKVNKKLPHQCLLWTYGMLISQGGRKSTCPFFCSVYQEYNRYFAARQALSLCLRNFQPNFRQTIMSKNSKSVGNCWGKGKTIVSSEYKLSLHAGFILSLELSDKICCSTRNSTLCCPTPSVILPAEYSMGRKALGPFAKEHGVTDGK